eukprot:g1217.t1
MTPGWISEHIHECDLCDWKNDMNYRVSELIESPKYDERGFDRFFSASKGSSIPRVCLDKRSACGSCALVQTIRANLLYVVWCAVANADCEAEKDYMRRLIVYTEGSLGHILKDCTMPFSSGGQSTMRGNFGVTKQHNAVLIIYNIAKTGDFDLLKKLISAKEFKYHFFIYGHIGDTILPANRLGPIHSGSRRYTDLWRQWVYYIVRGFANGFSPVAFSSLSHTTQSEVLTSLLCFQRISVPECVGLTICAFLGDVFDSHTLLKRPFAVSKDDVRARAQSCVPYTLQCSSLHVWEALFRQLHPIDKFDDDGNGDECDFQIEDDDDLDWKEYLHATIHISYHASAVMDLFRILRCMLTVKKNRDRIRDFKKSYSHDEYEPPLTRSSSNVLRRLKRKREEERDEVGIPSDPSLRNVPRSNAILDVPSNTSKAVVLGIVCTEYTEVPQQFRSCVELSELFEISNARLFTWTKVLTLIAKTFCNVDKVCSLVVLESAKFLLEALPICFEEINFVYQKGFREMAIRSCEELGIMRNAVRVDADAMYGYGAKQNCSCMLDPDRLRETLKRRRTVWGSKEPSTMRGIEIDCLCDLLAIAEVIEDFLVKFECV